MNNKFKILNRSITDVCVIGDVHSSPNELLSVISQARKRGINQFISVGDLWDRGYDPNKVIDVIAELISNNELELCLGNHDWKFLRHFAGKKVSIKEEQIETLSKLTKQTIDAFHGIFADQTVAIYDPKKKIFISHAAGARPAIVLQQDFKKSREHTFTLYDQYLNDTTDKIVDAKYVSNLLYGITNGEHDENGRPIRLPITTGVNDDLEGWTAVFGHHHCAEMFPENGNKQAICVDYCSGEPGGKLAGLIIRDDTRVSEEDLIFSE